MTNDRKPTEWRRFCNELDALGVDRYLPKVPEDDDRYEQVQAITAEYRGVPQPLFPIPETWEGSQPLLTLTSLDDVATWLRDEWNIVIATKMGSVDGLFLARRRALQAVRNAHRILDVLGIENRPTRQLPAETLAESNQQMFHLEEWFQKTHKSGWKPTNKAVVHVAKASRTHDKRREAVPDDEADLLAKRFLEENPEATARDIKNEIGIALGRVSSLPSWRRVMAERKSRRRPSKKKERQLDDKMLSAIGKMNDPAQQIMRDELGERYILENATEEERSKFLEKPIEKRQALIQATLEQIQDGSPSDCG
jgi:hypothetical protein